MLKFLNMLASCMEYVMVDIDKDIGVRTTTAVRKLLVGFQFFSMASMAARQVDWTSNIII